MILLPFRAKPPPLRFVWNLYCQVSAEPDWNQENHSMMNATMRLGLAVAMVGFMAATAGQAQAGTTITFDESSSASFASGFNAQSNPFFVTSDGDYRVEAIWLNASAHFHTSQSGGNFFEANHNNSGGTPSGIQGIRVTRTDSGAFDLVSMGLVGQVAIGNVTNFTSGAGTFGLYSGVSLAAGEVSFGSSFLNLTSIIFADSGRAGGISGGNWDNILVQSSVSAVPEPSSIALACTAIPMGLGFALKRRRKVVAV